MSKSTVARSIMANWLQKQWQDYNIYHIVLLPLSWVFCVISHSIKMLYQIGWLKSVRLAVPVIVVGNINVGGTGKTPLVIWLAEQLKIAGFTPGIISRGYGGNNRQVQAVFANSNAAEVGDEPVLIARRANCPVFVSANRAEAGVALLKAHPKCDVIISDDGLQHYRLQRDVEIAVFDAAKGFGNSALLPAGPLRELKARLNTVDAVVSNGKSIDNLVTITKPLIEMQLKSGSFYNLLDLHKQCETGEFTNKSVLAIAGIGNPERFFQQLRAIGLNFQTKSYSDHHAFQASDFEAINADIVLMTEKDAVKCQPFAQANFWALPVNAIINDDLMAIIIRKLS